LFEFFTSNNLPLLNLFSGGFEKSVEFRAFFVVHVVIVLGGIEFKDKAFGRFGVGVFEHKTTACEFGSEW